MLNYVLTYNKEIRTFLAANILTCPLCRAFGAYIRPAGAYKKQLHGDLNGYPEIPRAQLLPIFLGQNI